MSERQARSYSGEMMAKGREVELAVIRWLESKGYTVLDATQNKFMQKQDVDIIIKKEEEAPELCEIKADYNMSSTQNLCFEILRVYHNAALFDHGWATKSPAKYLFVGTPDTNEIYFFNFEQLRIKAVEYIRNVGRIIRMATVETDNTKTTISLLIPLKSLEGAYKVQPLLNN